MPLRTTPVAAALALLAFAGNSLLCRLALRTGEADPVSFTVLRLVAGAACLWAIGRMQRWPAGGRSWWPAAWLALYAMAFSWAYVRLNAGTGALLLFGSVQLTMLTVARWRGEALSPWFWVGASLAAGGVAWLVLPGATAPDPAAAVAMAAAGLSWGGYTLAGRGVTNPGAATRDHFARAVVLVIPMAVVALLASAAVTTGADGRMASLAWGLPTARGMWLAVLSGAVTSGLGYVLWYAALRTMTASRAAVLQLTVPVLTAAVAVPLLGERPSWRLAAASALVLGGIGLTIQRPSAQGAPR